MNLPPDRLAELRSPLDAAHLAAPGSWGENIRVGDGFSSDALCSTCENLSAERQLCLLLSARCFGFMSVGDVIHVDSRADDPAAASSSLQMQVASSRRPCSEVDQTFGKTWGTCMTHCP